MNKDIIILASKEENIKKIKTICELSGYSAYFAYDLNDFFHIIERFIPLAVFIVEEDEEKTAIFLREIKRHFPLLPIIIMMSEKNHVKREKYSSTGVFDVIEFPWTEISFAKTINSVENLNLKIEKEEKKVTKKLNLSLTSVISSVLIFTLVLIIPIMFNKTQNNISSKPKEISIPSSTISGFFVRGNEIYVYDWAVQTFYILDREKKEIIKTKKFFTPYIITLIKDSNHNFFFALTDTGEIKKILKDEKFTEIASIKKPDTKDICYDGMYVWIFEDHYINKSLNNDQLSVMENYILSDELSGAKFISCENETLIYYTGSKLIKTSTLNPLKINSSMTFPYQISAFNINNGNIIYINNQKDISILKEIKF